MLAHLSVKGMPFVQVHVHMYVCRYYEQQCHKQRAYVPTFLLDIHLGVRILDRRACVVSILVDNTKL